MKRVDFKLRAKVMEPGELSYLGRVCGLRNDMVHTHLSEGHRLIANPTSLPANGPDCQPFTG